MGYYIPEENFEKMISRIKLMAMLYLFCEDLPFAHVFHFQSGFLYSFFLHLNNSKDNYNMYTGLYQECQPSGCILKKIACSGLLPLTKPIRMNF